MVNMTVCEREIVVLVGSKSQLWIVRYYAMMEKSTINTMSLQNEALNGFSVIILFVNNFSSEN